MKEAHPTRYTSSIESVTKNFKWGILKTDIIQMYFLLHDTFIPVNNLTLGELFVWMTHNNFAVIP